MADLRLSEAYMTPYMARRPSCICLLPCDHHSAKFKGNFNRNPRPQALLMDPSSSFLLSVGKSMLRLMMMSLRFGSLGRSFDVYIAFIVDVWGILIGSLDLPFIDRCSSLMIPRKPSAGIVCFQEKILSSRRTREWVSFVRGRINLSLNAWKWHLGSFRPLVSHHHRRHDSIEWEHNFAIN